MVQPSLFPHTPPPDVDDRDYVAELEACLIRHNALDIDAVLKTSSPPVFATAANPFLAEYVNRWSHTERAANRVDSKWHASEVLRPDGDPIHRFHPYHTKVPPDAIRELLVRFTQPGNLVIDPFCGSGMTGVAAASLGRHAVLSDLAPAAAFISGVNCSKHDSHQAAALLHDIIAVSEREYGWLFQSVDDDVRRHVDYYVWSDIFNCPKCNHEFPFFPSGVIHTGNKVITKKAFPCSRCGAELNVRMANRVLRGGVKARALVWIRGGRGARRFNRPPTDQDIEQMSRIPIPAAWFPTDKIDPEGYSAKLAQLGDKAIIDVSCLLGPNNLVIFSDLWNRVAHEPDSQTRTLALATLTSTFNVISERQGYFGGGGGMSGNLYMPIVRMEKNPYDAIRRKIPRMLEAERSKQAWKGDAIVSTQSATDLSAVPPNSIDFAYTDPPFGANIIYSEVNRVLESWLGVLTNDSCEAVVDPSRPEKSPEGYGILMVSALKELKRVLKPESRLAVEFHNASADLWNVFLEALRESGFTTEQVLTLDKGSTTILGDIRPGAAKHDLIVVCVQADVAPVEYGVLDTRAVWSIISERLGQLPRQPRKNEREAEMLYGYLLEHCIVHGLKVPISAVDFYRGLDWRFDRRGRDYFSSSDNVT